MRLALVAFILLALGATMAAKPSVAVHGGDSCVDPDPNGGGTMKFSGFGMLVHTATREGSLCPGGSDTWQMPTVSLPIDIELDAQIVKVSGPVKATMYLPNGVEYALEPGTTLRVATRVDTPVKITVTAAGDGLAAYRLELCSTLPYYAPCTLSNAVTSKPGDVDCSGTVDAKDALAILQLSAGLLETLRCPDVSQVYADSITNALDAELILQFSAGLISELPVLPPYPG